MDYPVIHDEKNHRFEIRLNGSVAYEMYRMIDGNIAYEHTVVPPSLSGRGIGNYLVKYVLDYAQAQGLKVRPSCSFVKAYIDKHPEYQANSLYHQAAA